MVEASFVDVTNPLKLGPSKKPYVCADFAPRPAFAGYDQATTRGFFARTLFHSYGASFGINRIPTRSDSGADRQRDDEGGPYGPP